MNSTEARYCDSSTEQIKLNSSIWNVVCGNQTIYNRFRFEFVIALWALAGFYWIFLQLFLEQFFFVILIENKDDK